MSHQIGGQIWMNCATETLQTLSITASGDWWVQFSLRCSEGFKCCQMETPGSSEQLGVLPVHCANAQFLLRAWWDERGKWPKLPWCHHLPKEHGGACCVGLKSVYEYPEKTILQQSFSPRYEFCRSHAWELCSMLQQAHSPHTQILSHYSARKQMNTESRGWGPAAFHECGCTTGGGDEPAALHIWTGRRIPLRVGTVGRDDAMPTTSPGDLSLLILAEGHHNSPSWGPQPLEQLQVSHASRDAIIWKPLCHANNIRKS